MLRIVAAIVALCAALIVIKDARHWRTGDPRHASLRTVVVSVLILLGLSVAAHARPSPYPPVTQFNGDRYAGTAQLGAEVAREAQRQRRAGKKLNRRATAAHRRHWKRVPVPAPRPESAPREVTSGAYRADLPPAIREAVRREEARVIGGRPHGCPSRFCGCGASLHLFGRIIPALNLAANWLRFPRAAPALDMVAARRGHVFVLKYHISGNTWMVFDANSGGRRIRIHPRSIAGFTIVNPYRSNS
jgi:hypothetical protein